MNGIIEISSIRTPVNSRKQEVVTEIIRLAVFLDREEAEFWTVVGGSARRRCVDTRPASHTVGPIK